MTTRNDSFDEHAVLRELKHFLPAMEPWGQLTYRNPLQGFQEQTFHDALLNAYEMTGMQTRLSLEEYRSFYNAKRVKPEVLERIIVERKGSGATFEWQDKVLMKKFPASTPPRVGALRANWKKQYAVDPDAAIHPVLFRILGNYTDQGQSGGKFPVSGLGFLDSMREMESGSFFSLFKTSRARNLLLHTLPGIADLLGLLVGEEKLFSQYLFDQQFAHRGWSGLVARLQDQPHSLPDDRSISLHDLVVFELLLEIDLLDHKLKTQWAPLASKLAQWPADIFAPAIADEKSEVQSIWQDALEWSHYESVIARFQQNPRTEPRMEAGWHTSGQTVDGEPPATVCLIGRASNGPDIRNRIAGLPYEYASDRNGDRLECILATVVPSFGAANLEYFFSRTNLEKTDKAGATDDYLTALGAVANGNGGDLLTGLPAYLVNGYEPMRLLMVVEQMPDIVLNVVGRLDSLHAWLNNEWVHLIAIDPESRELRVFRNGEMVAYKSDRRVAESAVH